MTTEFKLIRNAAIAALCVGLPLIAAHAAPVVLNTGTEIGLGTSHRVTGDIPNAPAQSDIISYNNGGFQSEEVTDPQQVRYNRARWGAAFGGDVMADSNANSNNDYAADANASDAQANARARAPRHAPSGNVAKQFEEDGGVRVR